MDILKSFLTSRPVYSSYSLLSRIIRKGYVSFKMGETSFDNSEYARSISDFDHVCSQSPNSIFITVPCSSLLQGSIRHSFSTSVKKVFFLRLFPVSCMLAISSYFRQSKSKMTLRVVPRCVVSILTFEPNFSTAKRPTPFSPTTVRLYGAGDTLLTRLLLVPITIHL